jgi:hypothetical protein
MAVVGNLHLAIAIRGIKLLPNLETKSKVILLPRDLPFLLDPKNHQIVVATYLLVENEVTMTSERLHTLTIGERIIYGPIATELNVMTI